MHDTVYAYSPTHHGHVLQWNSLKLQNILTSMKWLACCKIMCCYSNAKKVSSLEIDLSFYTHHVIPLYLGHTASKNAIRE